MHRVLSGRVTPRVPSVRGFNQVELPIDRGILRSRVAVQASLPLDSLLLSNVYSYLDDKLPLDEFSSEEMSSPQTTIGCQATLEVSCEIWGYLQKISYSKVRCREISSCLQIISCPQMSCYH